MLKIFQWKKKSNAKKANKKIKGHFDEYDGSHIRGWACSKEDASPLNLSLYINDKEYLTFSADKFRQDLKDVGIHNGYVAFTKSLDIQKVVYEFGHDAVLRIKDRASGEELMDSPITLKKPDLKWSVDLYSDDEFAGWVVDVNNESLQIKINVYINNELVGDVAANLERADLASIGIKNCHHGFHIDFSRFSKGKELFKIKFEIEYGDTQLLGEEKEVFSFQAKLKELTELQHYLRNNNYGKQSIEKNYLVKSILPGLIDACREQRNVPAKGVVLANTVEAKPEIAVVVPVYKGVQETLNCLNSVLNSQNYQTYRLIVINDCGPEEEMQPALEALANKFNFELLYNKDNLGFVGTVNRGMKLSVGHDIILLNSDTVVADGWLDGIVSVAVSSATIGTVTPMSNNATICSYPNFCLDNELPSGYSVNQIAALCKDNAEAPVELPTAHGYCMFIKRVVLNEVGYFDEQKWGKGYGEENDFSLRASKFGWKHVVTNKTFVHHLGSVSFAEDTEGFIATNLEKLNDLYPDYPMLVQKFIREDPVRSLRKELGKKFLKNELTNNEVSLPAKGKSMLFVSLSIGGGTKVATDDLAKLLHEEGQSVFMLTTKDNLIWEVSSHITNATAQFDITSEYDELIGFLKELDVWHIHYHHVLEFGENVWDIPSELDCQYDVTVHDYFSICPRVNLLTENDAFCGQPTEKACGECLEKMGVHDSSFLQLNDLGGSIKEWRGYFFEKLAGARKVITPSKDTKSRVVKYLPLKNIETLYHPETVEVIKFKSKPKNEAGSINIGFIGAIGPHKGLQVIKDLANEIANSNSNAKITIVGYTSDDSYFDRYDFVTITGPYKKKNLKETILEEEIDVIFLASIWPETFSYTYSEVIRLGFLVVALPIGAIAERIVGNDRGLLVTDLAPFSLLKSLEDFAREEYKVYELGVGKNYRGTIDKYYVF
jgi:GT2 family glycosyltransferase/glycosyltransferase involved in cell wall biosynthesis